MRPPHEGLRSGITRQGEDALGKLAQDLLENPLLNGAITRALRGAGEGGPGPGGRDGRPEHPLGGRRRAPDAPRAVGLAAPRGHRGRRRPPRRAPRHAWRRDAGTGRAPRAHRGSSWRPWPPRSRGWPRRSPGGAPVPRSQERLEVRRDRARVSEPFDSPDAVPGGHRPGVLDDERGPGRWGPSCATPTCPQRFEFDDLDLVVNIRAGRRRARATSHWEWTDDVDWEPKVQMTMSLRGREQVLPGQGERPDRDRAAPDQDRRRRQGRAEADPDHQAGLRAVPRDGRVASTRTSSLSTSQPR